METTLEMSQNNTLICIKLKKNAELDVNTFIRKYYLVYLAEEEVTLSRTNKTQGR